MTSLIFDVIGSLYPKDQDQSKYFYCQQILLNQLHKRQKFRDMHGCHQSVIDAGFYRTQYPVSYTHKSFGSTRQFTLPGSTGTQTCLLCLSVKSQIPKLFGNDSGFPIFTGYL